MFYLELSKKTNTIIVNLLTLKSTDNQADMQANELPRYCNRSNMEGS